MNNKFRLLENETTKFHGHTLYRIEALRDIRGHAKAGEKGGWVESENNLSLYGECWIGGEAIVYENALVSDDALVDFGAQVFGNALVRHNAWVSDTAKVYGNAWVFGHARVYGNAKVYDFAWVNNYAKVYGKARVHGSAVINGNMVIEKSSKLRWMIDILINKIKKAITGGNENE